MKVYSLLLGARNGRRRFSVRDEALLIEICTRHFPQGFTILHASGVWFDGGRSALRREESRQILVCTNGRHGLRAWSVAIGKAFAQKEVMLLALGDARRYRIG